MDNVFPSKQNKDTQNDQKNDPKPGKNNRFAAAFEDFEKQPDQGKFVKKQRSGSK